MSECRLSTKPAKQLEKGKRDLSKLLKAEGHQIIHMPQRGKKALGRTQGQASRVNQTYKLLREGKSPKEIADNMKTHIAVVHRYIGILREAFKTRLAFIPPKRVHGPTPETIRSAKLVINLAKEIIQREARPKVKTARPRTKKIQRVRRALKRNPNRSNTQIARALGLPKSNVVDYQRKLLVEKGTIPEVNLNRLRDRGDKSKRGYVLRNKAKRQEVIEKNNEKIRRAAEKLYHSARNAFNQANMYVEDIVEEIKRRLDWRLQKYKPSRTKAPKEKKLKFYIDYCLKMITAELRREAWRKYRKIESLETDIGRGAGEKKIEGRDTLEARPVDLFEGITVRQLEQISKRLGLTVIEQAVLYGLAANITGEEIGRRLGRSESRISQIKANLFGRVKSTQEREGI